MTNEAQTNIVIAQAKKMLPMMKSTLGESIERYAEFYKKSLLNMVEWKDKQFKECLEKKKEETESIRKCATRDYQRAMAQDRCKLITEIIDEFFKKD